MDNRENLWTRRSNTSKLSLTTSQADHQNDHPPTRTFSATAKRFGGDTSSHGGRNPFNAISPLTPGALASPTTGGSSAFGLGSGAFASFGSANKTPKTPGTAFDFKTASTPAAVPTTPAERKLPSKIMNSARKEPAASSAQQESAPMPSEPLDPSAPWPLKYTWVVWFRPPTPKNNDYEKSMKALCRMSTAQDFWRVFVHLKRPSSLPTVSDYHVFKEGIRPVWEDEENKKGGKWIMRLKKGVADRYWEELLMACIGDQFAEAGEEVCGFVLSVRSGEDVFSIWTKNDGGRNIKIRETVKRVLGLPEGTQIIWRSHDDSIAQRTAIDQARQEKNHLNHEKRRVTSSDESQREKSTAALPWERTPRQSARQNQQKARGDPFFRSAVWLEIANGLNNSGPHFRISTLTRPRNRTLETWFPARGSHKIMRVWEDAQSEDGPLLRQFRWDDASLQSLEAVTTTITKKDSVYGSTTSCEASDSTAGDSQDSSNDTTTEIT